MHLPLFLLLLLFVFSLAIAIGAAAWFTQQLEAICDIFDLSVSLLSLLGALGANIPNYVASITAIADGQSAVGVGIIIGSNIYNVAIILAISTFATSARQGIVLSSKEAQDAHVVALYTLAIMLITLCSIWILSLPLPSFNTSISWTAIGIVIVVNLASLGIFGMLSRHALHRVPHEEHIIHVDEEVLTTNTISATMRIRVVGEALLALLIALGAVIIMVQSAQGAARDIHLSPVILGLIILAIATSLPNTVVAFSLARTGRATACVEEVFSSNSINAALGIALPLLIWHSMLQDRLLLLLDAPLMVMLTLVGLLCILRQRVSHLAALGLLLVYVIWVVVHMVI